MPEENQAVRLLAAQHHRVGFFALFLVLRVAEQHRIAFALRGALDALQDLRKKRVGDVGHGDEQLAGLVRPEILCRRVRRKFKAFDRLQDSAASGRGDDARLAEDARDGCGRHTGAFGDVVNVSHAGAE